MAANFRSPTCGLLTDEQLETERKDILGEVEDDGRGGTQDWPVNLISGLPAARVSELLQNSARLSS